MRKAEEKPPATSSPALPAVKFRAERKLGGRAEALPHQTATTTGVVMLCLLGAIFATGLFQILRIRLVSGGLYPAWSSLRSDPDGTRVLFDSLAGTGRFETVRNYKRLEASRERNATILFPGFSPASLIQSSSGDLVEFEMAARSGNRLVVALEPRGWFNPPKQERDSALAKRWGVGVNQTPGDEDGDDAVELFFEKTEGWTPVVSAAGRPVVIERRFGSGSIVLAASSDAFANRNLATKRDSALLMRLIGPNARVVFDESHLGVADTGSILGLVRKYRMDGLLWGLLAFASVFVWSNAVGFPPPAAAGHLETIAGHDAGSGLGQLLRRQVPLSRLIETCVHEWERSNIRTRVALSGQDDPLAAYQAVQEQLEHFRKYCRTRSLPVAARNRSRPGASNSDGSYSICENALTRK